MTGCWKRRSTPLAQCVRPIRSGEQSGLASPSPASLYLLFLLESKRRVNFLRGFLLSYDLRSLCSHGRRLGFLGRPPGLLEDGELHRHEAAGRRPAGEYTRCVGPKGMDKMMASANGEVIITILQAVPYSGEDLGDPRMYVEREEIEFITKTLNCLPIANVEHFREEKLGLANCVEGGLGWVWEDGSDKGHGQDGD
ncbi:hypothetical protein BHM03_00023916 [Ensete ventricosum]|nr:hypothetical protein BHM03_00023916 [Ensete ventricosum]